MLPECPFPLLALTGGIASGKSHVAKIMEARGWVVFDADATARDVVTPQSEGLEALVEAFGPGILAQNGALDRAALAAIVFADSDAKMRIEALLHPRIESHLKKQLLNLPGNIRGALLDAALWVELGMAHHFDELWVIEAPDDIRLNRLMVRDALSEAQALIRMAAQSKFQEKALHADLVIKNDGRDLDSLLAQAECRLLANWSKSRCARWSHTMQLPFTPDQLHQVLSTLVSRGGDYAEVFVELRRSQALGMDDGRMEDVLSSEVFGVSLRLMDEEITRFADLITPSHEELLEAALTLAAPGNGIASTLPPLLPVPLPTPSPVALPPQGVSLHEKVELVRCTESIARSHAESLRPGSLRQVAVGYGDSTQHVWIASVEKEKDGWQGQIVQDCRIQSVLRVNATVGEGDQLQTGYQALGETRGFELFTEASVAQTATEAVRLAIQALDARPAPAGTFPVILSSSAGGTMIHEACGHGLEADLALAGMSAFAGKLGEQVAAEGVTIIDDGTLPHKRGSSACDDEGKATQRNVLIENGVLKQFLQSRKTAKRMGCEARGNGRRESYKHLPLPRMRNTFLAPGNDSPDAILKELEQGLLVKHMGGGQVDTVTGNFVFQVTEGYWVESGHVKYPIKNATLSGCGPEVLKQLTRIAGDLEHFDIGTCGKDGQGVPVSDALPTILCPALVVGGTAEPLPAVL